jgi:hypothetical protein
MPRNAMFKKLCGARLHGRPGQRCRQSPVPGRKRCKFHGGMSPRGPRPRLPGQQKPGPKPRDPAIAERRKARAELMRSRPDLAAVIPIVVEKGAPPGRVAAQPPSPPPSDARPCWPPDGYVGGPNVRWLEKAERTLIRQLSAPAINLEQALTNAAAGKLSRWEVEQVLTAFVETMRRDVEEQAARLMEAEQGIRRDGAEAIAARCDRMRWEIDSYITRLNTAKTLVVLRAEDRERRDYERARAASEATVGRYIDRAALRADRPRPEERPHTIAPWLRR